MRAFMFSPMLLLALSLCACTASDVLTVATAAVSAEIDVASTEGWSAGITYGDAGLSAIACVGSEYNTADAQIIKNLKYTACVTQAEAGIPVAANTTQQAVLAGINAALEVLLVAEGAAPVTPNTEEFAKLHRTTVQALHVSQYDGKEPSLFVRRSVAGASATALKKRQ